MKRWISAASLLLLLVAFSQAKAADPTYVGTWVCNAFTQGGKPIDENANMKIELLNDGKMVVTYNDQVLPGTYAVKAEQGKKNTTISFYTDALAGESPLFMEIELEGLNSKGFKGFFTFVEGKHLTGDEVVVGLFSRQ